MATIKGSWEEDDNKISYEITDEMKDKIVEELIEFYKTHLYFWEGIAQDDDSQIDAPDVLGYIADKIIKFHSKYSEDEKDN